VSLLVLDIVNGNNSLYEDEEEFGDSDADIVSSVVLVSSRRMFGCSMILLLNVLICSSNNNRIRNSMRH
jgi:hypothetical protein